MVGVGGSDAVEGEAADDVAWPCERGMGRENLGAEEAGWCGGP